MSIWDSYPAAYRKKEVETILKAAAAGECVSIVGLSGAGKSNLLGFLAHRVHADTCFLLVDCNDLPAADLPALYAVLLDALGADITPNPSFHALIDAAARCLELNPSGLSILIDRFDVFNTATSESKTVAANLRALRDRFKYELTFDLATRRPLEPASELAELFTGSTLWLGALDPEDASWSVSEYASRRRLDWNEETVWQILDLSQGYPSMLRAVCESFAAGVPLDISAMRSSDPVKRRVDEFWADMPLPEYLRASHLEHHPLLSRGAPLRINAADLTAAEQHLLDYFIAHPDQICSKDALIQAVWPEEKLIAGLRDDSLSQLVHRLREKLDTPDTKHIQTIPGRGYRYQQ